MNKKVNELKKAKDRQRCNTIKNQLEIYSLNLKLIDEYQKEISEKREELSTLRSGLGNTSEIKGGRVSKDDIIIRSLDYIDDLENELKATKKDTQKIKTAIKNIDDPLAKSIIMRIWVNKSDSMRSLANELNLSHTMVWRKSDIALLSLYKQLIK